MKEIWLPEELRLINSVELFQKKPAILKKAETYLYAIRDAMIPELPGGACFPDGADLVKGQLVRGENLKGFPFVSMDIPQFFTKTTYFTYRILFWWGHYLGFGLILKGENVPRYARTLISSKSEWPDIYLACADSPWEWERRDDTFKNIAQTPAEEIRGIIESVQYIKLCRFHPVGDKDFGNLDWCSAAIDAYREMIKITF